MHPHVAPTCGTGLHLSDDLVDEIEVSTLDVGPLTVVCVLMTAWTARTVWRFRRTPAGERLLPAGGLTILVVLTVTAGGFETRHQWVQADAARVVRVVSGNPNGTARCQRFSGDLLDLSSFQGFVSYDQRDVAQLRRDVCNDLAGWLLSGSGAPTSVQATAMHVVVHEAMHVAGDFNEASAECHAMQHDAQAAVLFGATPVQAAGLVTLYAEVTYPRMPDEYRSSDCVADGALDLSPGDGAFP